jgi:hypothetical protein
MPQCTLTQHSNKKKKKEKESLSEILREVNRGFVVKRLWCGRLSFLEADVETELGCKVFMRDPL